MDAIKENQMIFMMNESAKTLKEIVEVEYTIISFSLYEDKELEKLHVKHNVALKILDPQVKVELKEEKKKGITITTYQFNPEVLKPEGEKKPKIKRDIFKVQKNYESKKEENKNIIINMAEVNGKLARLITIPIEKKLFSLGEVTELTKELKKYQTQFHAKQKNIKGQQKIAMKKVFDKQQSEMKRQIVDKMRFKQLKVFNIESILSFLLQKTQKVSFLNIFDMQEMSRGLEDEEIIEKLENIIKEKNEELKTLMEIPQDTQTQCLKYNVESEDVEKYDNKSISSLFTIDNSKPPSVLGIHRMNAFDEKYFKPAANIKIKIYEKMYLKEQSNEFLSAAIEEFTKTWNDVMYISCTPIATIVKSMLENLSVSASFSKTFISSQTKLQESSIKDSLQILTYNELFERFKVAQELQLTENVKIQKYFTLQRLSRQNKPLEINKGESLVPRSIEKIVFLHYFYMMNKAFLANYQENEKQGQEKLLNYVYEHVMKVYELANQINDSYLFYEDKETRCTDIQKYCNFLAFLFKSLKHIKNIINRSFSICGVLKALFQNLQPKQNILLEYVIKNQTSIQTHEAIHYYDLYLQVIKENGQKLENELQYIYLKIHKLKADRIASQFIGIKSKVVQAVRSLSEIINKFDFVPLNKRDFINKFEIEKKIARLLMVLGRNEEALLILKKNHLIESVQKLFKFMLKQYSGNKRADKCLSIAKFFELQSAYDLALVYSRKAYEVTKNQMTRRKAKQYQTAFLIGFREQKFQEKHALQRYVKNNCTEEQFNSWENMSEEDQSGRQLFQNLRNNLSWDKQKQQSQILAGEMDQSFI